MPRFDAVLFDFGGVFTPSPFHALVEVARADGLPPETVLRAVFGGYDEDTQHPWHRLERGEVTVEAAVAEIVALAAGSGHAIDPIEMLTRGFGSGSVLREDVVDVVREVRAAGLRTAVVTNNVREFSAAWRALLPVDELFDVVVDSCEEGVRKPDPRIFHLTLDRLGGTAPERAVFLDDAPGNVRSARDVGLHGIEVGADHAPALAELRGLLAG